MKAFQALYERLDRVNGTRAKVAALVEHFRSAPAEDAAWALSLLLGKRRRRLITGRRLREILRDRGQLPDWLIDDCHGQVGDSAETISLLWPAVQERMRPVQAVHLPDIGNDDPLHWWMETLLPAIGSLKDDVQADAVVTLWHAVHQDTHFIVNKLLTGGFRVGVSTGLISRAIAEAFDLDETLVVQRLMGGFAPSATTFRQLTRAAEAEEQRSSGVPYPFFLASPLEPDRLEATPADQWQLEWKWDGIRGQLIHRSSGTYLWSRGEELVNDSFPELVELGQALPLGTVLDGEVICWREGEAGPLGCDQLQRRLGRKTVGATLKRECPMRFIAYDLLEQRGVDIRSEPLLKRQHQLAELLSHVHHPEGWRLQQSHSWPLGSWTDLDQERSRAREHKAEGLMLKHN